jgi:hypothetical protein
MIYSEKNIHAMTQTPVLRTGKAYRTNYFAAFSSNPTRLVGKLVDEGRLRKLQGGLYYAPAQSRWGALEPTPEVLLNTWLEGRRGRDWVFTGSEVWNALGLGATAVQAERWVYNYKRSGHVKLGNNRFFMRKIPFPRKPPVEWFVVDLLNHQSAAAVGHEALTSMLQVALAKKRFDPEKLKELALQYGRKSTLATVEFATAKAER